MSDWKKHERAAIEAVARRFSATWGKSQGASGASITVDGRLIAVTIATLKRLGTGRRNVAKPRLRFDKVATSLIERLQATLGGIVPDGMTMLLTVTAPICLPSKTAAALEDETQFLLRRKSSGRDVKETIHGNRVRIRILRGESKRAPKMIGFVHNSDSNALLLLNMAQESIEQIGAESGKRVPGLAGIRWLVVISPRGISCPEVYRYIYSQLRAAAGFRKILAVNGDGHVDVLME